MLPPPRHSRLERKRGFRETKLRHGRSAPKSLNSWTSSDRKANLLSF
jgi:hypothetical protein